MPDVQKGGIQRIESVTKITFKITFQKQKGIEIEKNADVSFEFALPKNGADRNKIDADYMFCGGNVC